MKSPHQANALDVPRIWLLLWLVALVTLPLPYYVFALEVAPVLRMLTIGVATAMVWIAEGDLVPGLVVGFTLVPAAAYAILIYLTLRRLAQLLHRRWGSKRLRYAIGVAILCLLGLSLLPIYQTPLSNSAARASLCQVLQ